MRGSEFDELRFFEAIQNSRARALLIGRRALVLIGLPVLTADYDFWIAGDDIAAFNASCDVFGLRPTVEPAAARPRGRYVLQNDEHVDVLVARSVATTDGVEVHFEDVWTRRLCLTLGPGVDVQIPSVEDLILTKRFAARPKDLEDIRLLRILQSEREP
jgi:hypothetical protein